MSNEYLHSLYNTAMAQYRTELADAQADYTRAEASGDFSAAVEATKRMADVRVRSQEFHKMSEEHAANLRGPTYREPTREEILALPNEALSPELLRRPEFLTANMARLNPMMLGSRPANNGLPRRKGNKGADHVRHVGPGFGAIFDDCRTPGN